MPLIHWLIAVFGYSNIERVWNRVPKLSNATHYNFIIKSMSLWLKVWQDIESVKKALAPAATRSVAKVPPRRRHRTRTTPPPPEPDCPRTEIDVDDPGNRFIRMKKYNVFDRFWVPTMCYGGFVTSHHNLHLFFQNPKRKGQKIQRASRIRPQSFATRTPWSLLYHPTAARKG